VPIASRASTALVTLTELLLTVRVGDLLPPRHELAKRAGVGIGTLERAFDTLTSAGAVELDSVPRAGTKVSRMDYCALWRYADRSMLRGQLPLNLTVETEAIEVALGSALAAQSLEVSLVYREGAGRRARAITRNLGDFAVMSRSAFERFAGELSAVYGFGPGSYYGTIGLYRLRRDEDGPVRRVGVDKQSPDHVAMVRREYPSAEIVDTPFRLIPPQIVNRRLDATVWFGGAPLPVQYVSVLRAELVRGARTAGLLSSEAVVVAPTDGAAHNLFSELDGELLAKTFAHVVETGTQGAR
jgi:hypothetical protein